MVPVGNGAAIVAGQAGDGGAGIVFVVDAVVVCVRDGAAVIAGQAGDGTDRSRGETQTLAG